MGIYKEMAKAVHPDINPGVNDATAKMQTVNKFKNSPDVLLRLAKEWGLDIDTGKFSEDVFQSKAERSEAVYEAVVGAIVSFTYSKGGRRKRFYRGRGVIVDSKTIGKGKNIGDKTFKVFNFITGKIHSFRTKVGFNNDFQVVGMAHGDDVTFGLGALENKKQKAKRRSEYNKMAADSWFRIYNLEPNKNYRNEVVYVDTMGYRRCRLLRTTRQYLVVSFGPDDEKRIHIKKLWNVERG